MSPRPRRRAYRVALIDDPLTPRRQFRSVTHALREATELSRGDKRVAVWGTGEGAAEVVAVAFDGQVYVHAKQESTTPTERMIVYEGQRYQSLPEQESWGGTFKWERIPIGLVGVVFLIAAVVALWLLGKDRSSPEYLKYGGSALLFGILAFAHLRAALTGRVPQWLEHLADAGS